MSKPIFILSAGWRSGSTMLQRVITASGRALIWGEAGGAVDTLADTLSRYEQMLGPGNRRFKHGFGGNGSEEYNEFVAAGKDGVHKWVACMNAPEETFVSGLREFFESVYRRPAAEIGYESWGIKEVQSGVVAAKFLKGLYPEAKFVFLVRNPFSCLTSIKRRNWIDRPQDPNALEYYAKHWLRLAQEFRAVDFGLLVKYEDLITREESQSRLASYLEAESLLDDFANSKHVDWPPDHRESLSFWEKRRLRRIVGNESKCYGYL